MPNALEYFDPLRPPRRLHDFLESRKPRQAWDDIDEGALLLHAATRVGLDRGDVADLLSDAADSPALRRWRETGDTERLRQDARRYLRQAAAASSGNERRRRYAQYAAIMAALMPDREASHYSRAAQTYSGREVAAAKVRERVPFDRFEDLVEKHGMPEPDDDEEDLEE